MTIGLLGALALAMLASWRARRLGVRWHVDPVTGRGRFARKLTSAEVYALPCRDFAALTPAQRALTADVWAI